MAVDIGLGRHSVKAGRMLSSEGRPYVASGVERVVHHAQATLWFGCAVWWGAHVGWQVEPAAGHAGGNIEARFCRSARHGAEVATPMAAVAQHLGQAGVVQGGIHCAPLASLAVANLPAMQHLVESVIELWRNW